MANFVSTPLPDRFYAGLDLSKSEDDAKTFFENRIRRSDRNEVTDEFKKLLVLEAQKSRKVRHKQPRLSKKFLTARERRELGLYRLPKVGLRYAQFTGLNQLWLGYLQELMDLTQLEASGWTPGKIPSASEKFLFHFVYIFSSNCGNFVKTGTYLVKYRSRKFNQTSTGTSNQLLTDRKSI